MRSFSLSGIDNVLLRLIDNSAALLLGTGSTGTITAQGSDWIDGFVGSVTLKGSYGGLASVEDGEHMLARFDAFVKLWTVAGARDGAVI
jgi:hypothetical protein